MPSDQQLTRDKIVHKFLQFPDTPVKEYVKLFKVTRKTVYSTLKKFREASTVERSAGTGRKSGTLDKKLATKVKHSFKAHPNMSNRDRAKKFGTSATTVRRIKSRAGLKSYKAIKYPNRSDKQETTAKKRSRLLYDNILTKFKGCILQDDETYVKLDFNQIPGSKFYVGSKRGAVQKKFKYIYMEKFAKKAMVWQCVCSCGLKSQPFVTTSSMNADLYIKECLQKRLLPFIKLHNVPTIFWPDLASCHYAQKTMKWFKDNNIAVVPKDFNPPNCPQFRGIEKFWAVVKGNLKKTGSSAKTIDSLKKKWIQQANKVSPDVVRALLGGLNKKVRDFIRNNE